MKTTLNPVFGMLSKLARISEKMIIGTIGDEIKIELVGDVAISVSLPANGSKIEPVVVQTNALIAAVQSLSGDFTVSNHKSSLMFTHSGGTSRIPVLLDPPEFLQNVNPDKWIDTDAQKFIQEIDLACSFSGTQSVTVDVSFSIKSDLLTLRSCDGFSFFTSNYKVDYQDELKFSIAKTALANLKIVSSILDARISFGIVANRFVVFRGDNFLVRIPLSGLAYPNISPYPSKIKAKIDRKILEDALSSINGFIRYSNDVKTCSFAIYKGEVLLNFRSSSGDCQQKFEVQDQSIQFDINVDPLRLEQAVGSLSGEQIELSITDVSVDFNSFGRNIIVIQTKN